MNDLEQRLIKLEKVAHPPQNYRKRCKEMEKKVADMEIRMDSLEQIINEHLI